MYLQLHDGPGMGSIQGVPDIPLPQALKASTQQVLAQAADVAIKYAQKQVAKQDLPDLDPSLFEDVEFDEELQDKGMGAWPAFLVKAGQFIVKFGPQIYEGIKAAAKAVPLFVFNRRVQSLYNDNRYQVQQLNSLNRQQIQAQLKVITADLLNANQMGEKREVAVLSRFSQVYQLRLEMLPAISQRTLLIGGGAVLAYLLLKK
jgi:hypothetical protein